VTRALAVQALLRLETRSNRELVNTLLHCYAQLGTEPLEPITHMDEEVAHKLDESDVAKIVELVLNAPFIRIDSGCIAPIMMLIALAGPRAQALRQRMASVLFQLIDPEHMIFFFPSLALIRQLQPTVVAGSVHHQRLLNMLNEPRSLRADRLVFDILQMNGLI